MSALNTDLSKPTCRVCLESNHDEEMASIFDVDVDFCNVHIYEKIEQCADIKIVRHEQMPTLICGDCYGLLKVSYRFRTICRNSNEYLKQFLTIEFASSKMEKSLIEQNPLSISENIPKKEGTRSQYKKRIKACSLPETIKIEEISISHSPINFDEFIEGNIDSEERLDIDCQDDTTCENNEFSTEKNYLDVTNEIEQPLKIKTTTKRKKKSNAKEKQISTATSKTLEISSDGAAIIREKKPRAKTVKKEKQPHICEVCGNMYQHRYSLELHMRRHRDEKPFGCEICGHAFHSNFQLIRHMRKHTGDRPYKCSYCPRAFGDQSTLIKHERVHRNERPFKCETCGKSFSYTGVLNYHKLTHTGEKPYACELCGKCFNSPHHLRSHLKTLQHQNDPRTPMLLQNIRKNNLGEAVSVKSFAL